MDRQQQQTPEAVKMEAPKGDEQRDRPLSLTDLVAKPSDKTDLAGRLADFALQAAEETNTRGMAGRAVVNALRAMDIDMPRSPAKDIQNIPGMVEVKDRTNLKPGDVVVIQPQQDDNVSVSKNGNAFIVTKDGRAASDHVFNMPNLAAFNNVRVYRAEK